MVAVMLLDQDRFIRSFLVSLMLLPGIILADFVTDSDLSPDPSVTFGTLPNGMTYALMPNAEPKDRVSLRIFVEAGSIQEKDHQRGIAHYLEHMLFNGTTHFPAGEMVEFFQRMGMGFGSHTNAYTSFDQTVYMLELPDFQDEFVEPALQLFRDVGDGILFEPEELEKERGVILSEKQVRDTPQFRMFEKEYEFLMYGTLAAERMVIGTEEAIRGVTQEDFFEYYQAYYRPENMALIFVGDFEVEPMVEAIEAAFEGFKKDPPAVVAPDLGTLPADAPQFGFFAEPEAPYAVVGINLVEPYSGLPDSRAQRIEDLKLDLAYSMINRRFEKRAKDADASFLNASVSQSGYFKFAEVHGFGFTCQPDIWEASLAEGEQMIRQVLAYGFTQAELDEIRARRINALEESVVRKTTRNSRSLSYGIIGAYSDDTVYMSPEGELELFKPAYEAVTVEEIHDAFKQVWGAAEPRIFVAGKVNIDGDPERAIEGVWQSSAQVEVVAPEEVVVAEFAYQDFGTPGVIGSRSVVEDLAITQLSLGNGIRVNYKQTDFKENQISITARIAGGMLTLPEDKPELLTFTNQTFGDAGLVAHSADELEAIFAGKTMSLGFSVDEDAFVFNGSASPADLPDLLNYLTAWITAPGYRSEATPVAKRYFEAVEKYINHSAEGVIWDAVPHFLHGDDPRFGWPERAKLDLLTIDDVKAWLSSYLGSAFMEISVVGDFEAEALETELLRTVATLPPRAPTPRPLSESRTVMKPEGGVDPVFQFVSEQDKGVTMVVWPTDDMEDIEKTRSLNVVAGVLSDRLRIEVRERLGESYSPRANHSASQVFDDYGYITAQVFGDAARVGIVREAVLAAAESIRNEGTNEEELERILKPRLRSIEEQMRNNSYWLYTVMADSSQKPEKFDWARTIESSYASISVEDINRLARAYLNPEARNVVMVLPFVTAD